MTYLQQAFGNKNPNLPFHPAVRAGDYVFVSGQVAKDENGVMLEGTIEQLTRATIEAMRRALRAADCDRPTWSRPPSTWKTRAILAATTACSRSTSRTGCSRTTVEARAVIDTKIEIECIAYKPQRS